MLFISNSNAFSHGYEFDYGFCVDDQTNNNSGGAPESMIYEFKHININCMIEPTKKGVTYRLTYPKGESGIVCSQLQFHIEIDNTDLCLSEFNISDVSIKGITNPNITSSSQVRWQDQPAADTLDVAKLLNDPATCRFALCGAAGNCYARRRYINDNIPFWFIYSVPVGGAYKK